MLEHMTVFVIWSTAYLSLGYELSIPLAYIESSGSSSVGFPYIGKQMATKNIIVWAVFSSMIGKSHKCLWIKIAQQMNTKIRKLFLVYVKSRDGNIKHHYIIIKSWFLCQNHKPTLSNHSLFMEVNILTNIPYSTIPVALYDDPSSYHICYAY